MASVIPDEQYETQFFGFSPSSFLDGVKGLILDRLSEATEQLEGHLTQIPEEIISKEEVSRGIDLLRQQTDSNYTKTMQKLEAHILGNVMKIPSHVLLPSDIEQQSQVSASDITLLYTEMEKLRTQLKNEKLMQAKLEDELQDIEQVLEEQQKMKTEVFNEGWMTQLEEAKEKLLFVQGNDEETLAVAAAIQKKKAELKISGNTPSAVQILTKDILK
ncbi:protein MIS12 homolog [Penaeus chinensis]|uniref:protein MIS12 homolog n=1 Tax=Penaeus chinensis TaxID=139456 RepID=UPI001FB5DEE9|nr:protein MIS12 homolog [Penaeus chinensis]